MGQDGFVSPDCAFKHAEISQLGPCGYFRYDNVTCNGISVKREIVYACDHSPQRAVWGRQGIMADCGLCAEFHDAFAGETWTIMFFRTHRSPASDRVRFDADDVIDDDCGVTVRDQGCNVWKIRHSTHFRKRTVIVENNITKGDYSANLKSF
jgi:hypothetical protein